MHTFDTHYWFKKFVSVGFTEAQAEVLIYAFVASMGFQTPLQISDQDKKSKGKTKKNT